MIAIDIASTASPFAVALIGGAVASSRARRRHENPMDAWIRWCIAGIVYFSLWVVVWFWTAPETTADAVGFAHSPFQFEVAGANLATGVLGLIAFRRHEWRLPLTLVCAIFWWHAALGHIYQALAHHDHTYNNTYSPLTIDLLPAVLLLLLARQRATQSAER